MLYERWRHIAHAHSKVVALREIASERQWTFGELARTAEQGNGVENEIIFPSSGSAEFIISVLRAWRCGQIVCPMETQQANPEVRPGLPPEIVHLKTTSATTGAPRLIAFTAEQLVADAENIVSTMGLRSEWANLGVISLAHSYGFSNLVLPLLLHGIPLILAGAPLPELLKRAALRGDSLTLPAVPALWRMWYEADAIPASVRLAISAGAPLPLNLEQSIFEKRGLKIHNFYGSSECGGIAYDATDTPRLDAACAGSPMRHVQLSVAEDGCLEVRSRAVGQTYWPEPTANLKGGVFRTSDLAQISADQVYLRGRASDQINIAGRKVSPESIEKVLSTHRAIRECLVFGVPAKEGERSEMIVACVVSRFEIASEALKQFLLEKIPAWQVPREWWFVDSLSANARGKLSRGEWRKRFLEFAAAGEKTPSAS